MARFTSTRDGVRADLEAFEVDLLTDLAASIREALESDDVTDPALHRLFPVAVEDDEIEDATARLQFHDALLESRLRGLDALTEVLDRAEVRRGEVRRVTLVDDEPALFLGVMNDVRLALAARIGMDHVERRDLAEGDDRLAGLAVLDHLAWLQEQLVRILDPEASAHQDDPAFLRQLRDLED